MFNSRRGDARVWTNQALNCAPLGYHAASSGNSLSTFRNNLSVPSSRVMKNSWPLRMGPVGCPETSVRKCHYSVPNNPEKRSSQLLCGWSLKSRIEQWSLARQRPLLVRQNLLISSKHPHSPMSSCCCSLLVPIIVFKRLDASFGQSKPRSHLQNRRGLLFRLISKFVSPVKGAMPPNFN